MLSRMKKFFAPPVFEGDEDRTRRARLLNSVLLLDAAGMGLMVALRYGLARGIYANEAGYGTVPGQEIAVRDPAPHWNGTRALFSMVMRQVGRWELVAVVANQHIFVHFFLVLAVMLAFSNAILAFGSLFGRGEAGCLLALPINGITTSRVFFSTHSASVGSRSQVHSQNLRTPSEKT